jgi:hypothetical protein
MDSLMIMVKVRLFEADATRRSTDDKQQQKAAALKIEDPCIMTLLFLKEMLDRQEFDKQFCSFLEIKDERIGFLLAVE